MAGVHLVLGVALCAAPPTGASASAPSRAEGPVQEADTVGLLSQGGTDRGVLELGLASVTLATAVGLAVVGAVQIARGLDKREACNSFERPSDCDLDPPGLNFAAAGLSFGLMVPLIVAGSLWMRKGIRINRDWRAVQEREKLSWTLRGDRHSFGFGLRGRF